jgi:hypothetical protein
MAELLKQRMLNKQFFHPLLNWERPYRGDICTKLDVERYDLRKDVNVGFSHPWGTHDDVFWCVALAAYATADMGSEPFIPVIPREYQLPLRTLSPINFVQFQAIANLKKGVINDQQEGIEHSTPFRRLIFYPT